MRNEENNKSRCDQWKYHLIGPLLCEGRQNSDHKKILIRKCKTGQKTESAKSKKQTVNPHKTLVKYSN